MTKTKSNKKKPKSKFNYISLLISIIIIILVLMVNEFTAIRPIMWLLAIILLSINILYKIKPRPLNILIVFITLLFLSILVDGLISISFKRIPVFSYSVTRSNNIKVYNAVGLRIWQCDKEDYKNLIVDPFYQNGYLCNADDIDVIESNSFLNTVVSDYSSYKNKYVKIKGKISRKIGQNYLEMQPYENSSITVNGYVTFADNITLRAFFKKETPELDHYDIYDEITIVGLIKNLENNNGKYVIYMDETKIVSNINLNGFSIAVTKSNTCQDKKLLYNRGDKIIYSYCLEEMIIKYPDNNYEIATALSSNKLNLEDLYNNPLEVLQNDQDNSTILKFSDYSILICDDTLSKDVIIGSKNMTFDKVTCDIFTEQE